MAAIIEAESALTGRYQFTLPQTVCHALRLGKHDNTVCANGEVVLSCAEALQDDDPLISQFLNFLASDIVAHPGRLQLMDADCLQRLKLLVNHLEIDLDSPLPAENE